MEKLIVTLGNGFYQLDQLKENFFSFWVQKSEKHFILFILLSLMPIALLAVGFANLNFLLSGLYIKVIFFFLYMLIAFSLLVLTAGFYRGKAIKELKSTGFDFRKVNLAKINYEELRFDHEEIIDFQRLLLGRKVSQKIDFKLNTLSKISASYRDLFTMFHVLSPNGIHSYAAEQKNDFFEMLDEAFLMNRNPINRDTLESSFSTWKGKVKKGELDQSILKLNRLIGIE